MSMLDKLWRSLLTPEMGGEKFDAPSGGYSFSKVLEEERQLAADNVAGDSGAALLCLSIADPTWRMYVGAFLAGLKYFFMNLFSTRYTDNYGVNVCPEAGIMKSTHEQLADYLNIEYAVREIRFTPDMVQYSPGGIKRSLAEYLPTALFGLNVRLIFPTPGYGVIKDPKNRRKAEVIDVPMVCEDGRWDVDYKRISEIVREEPGCKHFLYLNIPHNPTGRAYSRDDWMRVIQWATDNHVILIVDEAYTHLRYGLSSSVLELDGWDSCCIVLQSVSKGWNATGLRFGWVVAHPTMIKAIRMVMDVKDSGLFGPSIAMGLWCLRHRECVSETEKSYRKLHAVLAEGLNRAGFATSMPDAGLCLFTAAPKSANGVVFASAAECAQWFRNALRISLMHYEVSGKQYLRWAVTLKPVPECGLTTEISVITEAVRRLQSIRFEF